MCFNFTQAWPSQQRRVSQNTAAHIQRHRCPAPRVLSSCPPRKSGIQLRPRPDLPHQQAALSFVERRNLKEVTSTLGDIDQPHSHPHTPTMHPTSVRSIELQSLHWQSLQGSGAGLTCKILLLGSAPGPGVYSH